MNVFAALPGLMDRTAVQRAHGIVRVAGLSGIAVFMPCFIALRLGWASDALAIPLVLSLAWSLAMLGLNLLLDARMGWMDGARGGFLIHLVIVFSIVGSTMFAAGTASLAYTSWWVLTS